MSVSVLCIFKHSRMLWTNIHFYFVHFALELMDIVMFRYTKLVHVRQNV